MHATVEHEANGSNRDMLRHAVATLAYRAGKALRGAPEDFAHFHAAAETRTPGEILAHMGDLMDWALSQAKGKQQWHDARALPWKEGTKRFFAGLQALDDFLLSAAPLGCASEILFQGPIADSITHVGQLAILRRMAGVPIRAENYAQAEIVTGRVGEEQAAPGKEF